MQLVVAHFLLLLLLHHNTSEAHNITRILAKHPNFSTFNHYLTETHLADEINRRETITVCAVDNAAMSDLLSKHVPVHTVKNIISLHVLLDYFGAKKLHQISKGTALAATMFQATGSARGSTGFVNITDLKGGKVAFGPAENHGNLPATFVKSIEEIPYNISVIQISTLLPYAVADAPAPAVSQMNITSLMSPHGCKVFAETLLSYPSAQSVFDESVDAGLTIFCPGDNAMKKFMPRFKNLTIQGKHSLLEYHGVPVYQSLSTLKSNNGVINTLATDGDKKYDFVVQNDGEEVTLETKLVTAKITETLTDEQPLAIFSIDKVLMPKELFKATSADTPAPGPAPATKSGKKKHKSPAVADAPADSPADGPSDDVADDSMADDSNGAYCDRVGPLLVGVFCMWMSFYFV